MTTDLTVRPFHFQMAVSCLAEILHARRPADVILHDEFRAHPQMGARDRASVSDLVYGVLRDHGRLAAIAGPAPRDLCAARLLLLGMDVNPLAMMNYDGAQALAARIASFDEASLTEQQRLNLPDWLYASLVDQYGPEETRSLALALNQPATVDLRVNTQRAGRDIARARLFTEGIVTLPTQLSPWGLRLPKRMPLQGTASYKEGLIEPQDEGSQVLALLVGAKPGFNVVDYCAGAGGKTLALAAAMKNQGRLFAFDTSAARLAKLGPRAYRAGISIVKTAALDGTDVQLKRLEGFCDAVLVDAPCSGTGTLRRTPELRLRKPDFPALQAQQASILKSAATLVRPGGVLVYATCSLNTEENEDVVGAFVRSRRDFTLENAGAFLRLREVAYEGVLLKLRPNRHGTDGFFAARLRRQD
jgi:16S rRNA (cytosine967-C5)-methyltransferase